MSENDIDIGTEIVNYIASRGLVRTKEVIAYFARKEPKRSGSKETDCKTNEENKKSKRTIQRKLEKMKKEGGSIVSLTSDQVKRYGEEDPDGRAKYLALRETVELVSYFDKMLKLFSTGSDIDKKMVLREIKRYENKYILSPSQLSVLASNLDRNDDELIYSLLEILYNCIINKKIKPKDKDVFVKKLRNLLEKYPEGHIEYTNLRNHTIRLLGVYRDDETIFKHLKKDIEAGRLLESKFAGDYGDKFTAKAIEKRRKDLFDLESRLRKEGNIETAEALAKIRDDAEKNADEPIEPDKPVEEVVGSTISELNTAKKIMGIKK